MLVSEWLATAAERLSRAKFESSALEAQVIAAHAAGLSRSELLAHLDAPVDHQANKFLERRLKGEPLAYILGYREFYGRRFKVVPGVLVPRQETETLVGAALALIADAEADVLDLGTGSGCIGITLKLEAPQARITLSDISPRALEIARENAQLLEASVAIIESDAFQDLDSRRFDVIVSNPPYVRSDDPLPREVREFEPGLALFAGGDGLDFYRLLAGRAREHLNVGGTLLVEVGDTQAEAVRELFRLAGWNSGGFWRDLGGVDRALEFGQ